MQKSIRLFALVAVLALTSTPMMYAGRAGCDPHPQAVQTSTLGTAVYTVLSVFGL